MAQPSPLSIPKWEPHSIESEQALLGAIFINNDAMSFVQDFLKKEHFFEPLHAEIFEICERLINMGKSADPISVRVFIPDGLVAEGMSVHKYLAQLAAHATTIINARDYGLNIRELYAHRRVIEIGAEMSRHVPRDVGTFASEALDELDSVMAEHGRVVDKPVSSAQAVALAVDGAAKAYQVDGFTIGLSWGLSGLDKKTSGLHPGNLVVIGGRPGMGKTALMLGIARNLLKAGHPGTIFSMEMAAEELTQRMIADEMFDTSPLAYTHLRAGRFQENTFERITEAGKRIASWPLVIEPAGSLTVSQIVAKARRAVRTRGLKWIAIDYLQLIKASGRYQGNRVLEIGEITSSLKQLAKELGIPVILLCQLNRQVEARDDKRPNLADLRESGNIEQDADVVLMLYREEYYVQKAYPKNARADSEEYASWTIRIKQVANTLDVLIEKQRQGPTGTVRLYCNIASNAVRNMAEEQGS